MSTLETNHQRPSQRKKSAPNDAARQWLTHWESGAKLKEQDAVPAKTERRVKVRLDPTNLKHKIVGFGGAITEAVALALSTLSAQKRKEVLRSYFHPKQGIGYTMCRTHINSCDFSRGNYSYVPAIDTSLASFSISPDEESIIPLFQEINQIQGAPVRTIASPWSPPAWMKTNQRMCGGGGLERKYYGLWATYIKRYIEEYQKCGIPIWGITPQNEPLSAAPWETCHYTHAECREFILALSKALNEANLNDVKILAWDHNKGYLPNHMDVVSSDLAAYDAIWGIAYHWYGEDDTAAEVDTKPLRYVHSAYKEKPLIMSECCNSLWECKEEGSRLNGLKGEWWPGEKYARHMISDMNAGTAAWIDWNIALNEDGGINHAGNLCHAPVIVDTINDEVHFESPYYVMAHFSKFIRPEARVTWSSAENGLKTLAAKNTDGTLAVIILNQQNQAASYLLEFEGHLEPLTGTLPGHSLVTWEIPFAQR